ncbi:hypothetical protein E2562_023287 [Oryza meyeriana var. granulata]|uniref:Peptidase S54 rhomboid domain-containing protein n=1 Tax=Oryza meyeriana var. granulata TaxID=110450 RepID=A0A6G1DM28_9ORYZ|nr:hypothetical protein E2562_023287 [Oryza meyeriana var. granulata]
MSASAPTLPPVGRRARARCIITAAISLTPLCLRRRRAHAFRLRLNPHGDPWLFLLVGKSFTGFTKLCKGLAVILFLGHIVIWLFPSTVTYLALIPSRTIPFAWNLVTSGYIEQTIPGVIVSIAGLLILGKVLEPLWGAKELLKFIFIVNLSTSVCVFVTAIVLYYITQQEIYLYTPFSGFYGVLSGFLVGIKQILPDQEVNLFLLNIKAKLEHHSVVRRFF